MHVDALRPVEGGIGNEDFLFAVDVSGYPSDAHLPDQLYGQFALLFEIVDQRLGIVIAQQRQVDALFLSVASLAAALGCYLPVVILFRPEPLAAVVAEAPALIGIYHEAFLLLVDCLSAGTA